MNKTNTALPLMEPEISCQEDELKSYTKCGQAGKGPHGDAEGAVRGHMTGSPDTGWGFTEDSWRG